MRRQATSTRESFGSLKPSNSVPILALSVEQACEALNVSWKIWHAEIEPEVRLVRITGRCKRVPVVELERWLADHAEKVID